MTRKHIILICSYIAVVTAAISAAVYYLQHHDKEEEVQITENDFTTNTRRTYEDENPVADPALVGRWENADNPQWHKMYLDDYDDNGWFWGKEWDESQDVYEEDLVYHGNGWFRWHKEKGVLTEVSTMDMRDVAIPKQWNIRIFADNDSLSLTDIIPPHRSCKFARSDAN